MIFDQGGKLYGTTVGDGTATGGHGSVFKLTPSASGWTESTLYTFTGGDDGASPYGERLIFDGAGNLYDTAYGGGTYGVGLVFEITR